MAFYFLPQFEIPVLTSILNFFIAVFIKIYKIPSTEGKHRGMGMDRSIKMDGDNLDACCLHLLISIDVPCSVMILLSGMCETDPFLHTFVISSFLSFLNLIFFLSFCTLLESRRILCKRFLTNVCHTFKLNKLFYFFLVFHLPSPSPSLSFLTLPLRILPLGSMFQLTIICSISNYHNLNQ